MKFGTIFESTEITPIPPIDKIGIIWSSFPEYICRLSWHKNLVFEICEIFPQASLIATMFFTFESSKHVSGSIFTPVRDGTLYKIIGRFVHEAIA